MATGAINVVRGTRSSNEELLQIYSHSDRYKGSFYMMKSFVYVLVHKKNVLVYQR